MNYEQLYDAWLAEKARADALTVERDEALRHLKSEQEAARRIVDRMCKAMGRWEGPWDNACEARLRALGQSEQLEANRER